jgi:hypothetical protein
MISLHITFTIFLDFNPNIYFFLLIYFKNHNIFFKTKTMVLIKTITLNKINKRHINRKNYFLKKIQNNCILKFNDNVKKNYLCIFHV